MVTTQWKAGPVGFVFAIECTCGASSSFILEARGDVGEDAPRASVDASRAERAAWAAFIHRARRESCRDCLSAAGRWLRQEPLFVPARAHVRSPGTAMRRAYAAR
jgi:hypothetical protein